MTARRRAWLASVLAAGIAATAVANAHGTELGFQPPLDFAPDYLYSGPQVVPAEEGWLAT